MKSIIKSLLVIGTLSAASIAISSCSSAGASGVSTPQTFSVQIIGNFMDYTNSTVFTYNAGNGIESNISALIPTGFQAGAIFKSQTQFYSDGTVSAESGAASYAPPSGATALGTWRCNSLILSNFTFDSPGASGTPMANSVFTFDFGNGNTIYTEGTEKANGTNGIFNTATAAIVGGTGIYAGKIGTMVGNLYVAPDYSYVEQTTFVFTN